MKALRLVLLAYCIIAVLVLAYLIYSSGSAAGASGAELKRVRSELETAVESARQKERSLTALETEQRDNRLSYSGQQAVEMSLNVQLALEEYKAASQLRTELETRELSLIDQRKAQQIRLVPYIALLLLHLLGLAYFIRPPRERLLPR